jgi:hypothetical protein
MALKISSKTVNGVMVVYCSGRIVFGDTPPPARE